MAHFAKVIDGVVTDCIVVSNDDCTGNFPESEKSGRKYLASLGYDPSEWYQTSYSGSFRGQFAGIGGYYDVNTDTFCDFIEYPIEESL